MSVLGILIINFSIMLDNSPNLTCVGCRAYTEPVLWTNLTPCRTKCDLYKPGSIWTKFTP